MNSTPFINNALLTIAPFLYNKTWVFNDASVGLVREPFVAGIPEMINRLLADRKVEDAENGFRMIFAATPFPNSIELELEYPEFGGNWYTCGEYQMRGWLCPALFKYFPIAPNKIYVNAETI